MSLTVQGFWQRNKNKKLMSKQNSENLLFDINKFGGKVSISDAYPELLPYTDVCNISSEVWKVAILMVDVGSDYIRIKDPKQKTDSIFQELGFDPKSPKYSSLYHDALQQRQSDLIDVCSFIIEYINNHEFGAWYELNKLYYELLRKVAVKLDPESDTYDSDFDKKLKYEERLSNMQKKLSTYEVNLFGTASMKAAVMYRSSKKKKMNWNEKYADENQVE